MNANSLHGRIAIVTGASRRQGIGVAITQALAAEGASIFFTDWTARGCCSPGRLFSQR